LDRPTVTYKYTSWTLGRATERFSFDRGGEVVLFDVGKDMKRKDCTKPVSYLDQIHVTEIDDLFVSHYHFDHIGRIPDVLEQFPLQHQAYDRGQSYPGATYAAYVEAFKPHRTSATPGTTVELDKGSGHSVVITSLAGFALAVLSAPARNGFAPPESVITCMAGFESAGSVITPLAGFAGEARPHPPGCRRAIPASLK
jgi:hypothetical protein